MFGYGSLMWDPAFEYLRSSPALLRGYHRAFCVYSTRYRGTPEQPGLVLGLDRGELDDVASTIACCSGAGGPNIDYLENTLKHLDELGIREGRLHEILRAVRAKCLRDN